ncbi:hypothetical protein FLAG1_06888 [Fusarium langsethiae]|uniref:Uncharacterized protein n=1 Tax=Fusarium langsethiae TaxID=179993 RepID=A0A0N1J2K7_FUSLA|nr:hypothetical protein FLAG1_06888 [Fusarium langsethiae]
MIIIPYVAEGFHHICNPGITPISAGQILDEMAQARYLMDPGTQRTQNWTEFSFWPVSTGACASSADMP